MVVDMSSNGPIRLATLLLLLIALACLVWPSFQQQRALTVSDQILQPPDFQHWFGTDALGRDLLARVLAGGRRSLAAGLISTIVACVLGTLLGAIAGSATRWVDTVLSRFADAVNAFPALLGALALFAGLGQLSSLRVPAAVTVGVVLGLFAWPALFRYVRAEVLRWSGSEVAVAGQAIGATAGRVALRHLIPLSLAPLLVPASFIAAGTILAEAGLGFLGLGITPPEPSWGSLLRDARASLSAWWLVMFPGLAVFFTVICCHLMADGLRRRLKLEQDS